MKSEPWVSRTTQAFAIKWPRFYGLSAIFVYKRSLLLKKRDLCRLHTNSPTSRPAVRWKEVGPAYRRPFRQRTKTGPSVGPMGKTMTWFGFLWSSPKSLTFKNSDVMLPIGRARRSGGQTSHGVTKSN